MKKIAALILALCLSIAAFSALAEDEIGFYTDEHPEAMAYVSTWVAEDGYWRIEVYDEDGGLKLMIVHTLGDNKEDIWEYSALLDDSQVLAAMPFGLHYQQDTVSGEWLEKYYEDGEADFTLNDSGKLVWTDKKEDAGKGLEFLKIGNFFGGRWMKDDIEVCFYDWYDDEYDIRLYQRGPNEEILKDAIAKGKYDAATDTITATVEFENEEPFDVTFSYDSNNNVVWSGNGEEKAMTYSMITAD